MDINEKQMQQLRMDVVERAIRESGDPEIVKQFLIEAFDLRTWMGSLINQIRLTGSITTKNHVLWSEAFQTVVLTESYKDERPEQGRT